MVIFFSPRAVRPEVKKNTPRSEVDDLPYPPTRKSVFLITLILSPPLPAAQTDLHDLSATTIPKRKKRFRSASELGLALNYHIILVINSFSLKKILV